MIVDPFRSFVEWWTDPVTGVNAQLPDVPRDATEDPPPAVRMVDELSNETLARGAISKDLLGDHNRVLAFLHYDDRAEGFAAPVVPEQDPQDRAVIQIGALYLVRPAPDTNLATLLRDARQTMRAVHRVVAQHFETITSPELVRNATAFTAPSARYFKDVRVVGDLLQVSAIVFAVPVLDRWALDVV